MQIEVAVPPTASTKDKGDLLERLSKKLLAAQSFEVITEIRLTAVELDLLCKHKVSGKTIYVECKAQRSNIDANILKNLLGTLTLQDYSEAWLISTAEFGKEAKGFVETWKTKDSAVATKMSFYSPALIIESLVNAGVFSLAPIAKAAELVGGSEYLGEWTLLVTPYGDFWAAAKLAGGIPSEIILFFANTGAPVTDVTLLQNVSTTDTSLASLSFAPARRVEPSVSAAQPEIVDVAQLQSGESWSDYRPSRPQDFVGRKAEIEAIFAFFKSIVSRTTATRVFAFTGNSGMGKSSLLAKITNTSKNRRNKQTNFLFPVDVRAATTSSYILSALLRCLTSAQAAGFGDPYVALNVTDPSDPLKSPSIRSFLQSLEQSGQMVVLILDQFEELYSKQELYHVFEQARLLLLAATAFAGNFCLGFAWKSDSTTPNEHPAYFFWHALADYRLTRKLSPFSDSESASVVNIFEKEIGQKLHSDLRHNLLVSSQGYPWLLKKLCIHLYEKLRGGTQQEDLLENKLDAKSLFDADLNQLGGAERACLDFVAKRAPVDWFEAIESSSVDALNSLINRRLVIRSGDRLNIYWDIFREYLLTQKVPIIPLRYLPATDFRTITKVVSVLSPRFPVMVSDIAKATGFELGTIQNIGTDLNTFGIAVRSDKGYQLAIDIAPDDPSAIAKKLREKFKRHAFAINLQDRPSNQEISVADAVLILKEIFPNNTYAEKTWTSYTLRLCRWLELCGFLISTRKGWIYRDRGDISATVPEVKWKAASDLFYAPTTPSTTVEAMEWTLREGLVPRTRPLPKGYRNAFYILSRFNLVATSADYISPNKHELERHGSIAEAVWSAAYTESSVQESIFFLKKNGNLSSEQLGTLLNEKLNLDWSVTSQKRIGGGLRQWALWIMAGKVSAAEGIYPKKADRQRSPVQ